MPRLLREFDIATAAQFLRRQGRASAGQPINPASVPETLRPLIPFVERWGVTCDVTRHEVGRRAARRDLKALTTVIALYREAIIDWLYSFEPGAARPPEAARYQALLVFEMEECDGPGIPGMLTYAIAKYRSSRTAANLLRLKEAHACIEVVAADASISFFSEELAIAANIIREAGAQAPVEQDIG